jgi:glycosyltransferase involved in cell wall biosynthesis
MKRIKILFVIDLIGGGGAQKVTTNIIKFINKSIFEVELALFTYKREFIYKPQLNIKYHNLKVKRTRYSILPFVHLLKKIKPSIIFSTLSRIDSTVNLALKISRINAKLILRSSNYLSIYLKENPFFTSFLSYWSYKNCDIIVASTYEMKKDMENNLNLNPDKIKVIHNPIDIEIIKRMSNESVNNDLFKEKDLENKPIIIAMGRLSKQKGYPYLFKAFKIVKNKLPSKLVILGKGESKEYLEDLVKDLGISKDIIFLGFQSNPYKYIANSDLFILSSLWEGFPNAIVEAMACGTPVVSTDCPSGPKEIITSGVNGILVPTRNPKALANAILKVLMDRDLSFKLVKAGRDRANDFKVKRIVGKYEELFKSTIGVIK